MASNIRVVLEIDNKKYISDVKAAENATTAFARSADTSLGKSGINFDVLGRKISGLKTLLIGLTFGAVGRSALEMADQLQDLSNSSGIAVGRLLELKKALTVAGGEADMMPQAVNAFLRSVDEAAAGSIVAQNAFMKLGVSLKDLSKLDERELLLKTLKGIADLPTATERATAMMQNFGKSFKTVDPQELYDKLISTAGSADKYAESIRRAAELNDQLATAQGNLKLAFLEAFSGPLQKLVDFNNQTSEGTAKMEGLITAIKLAGVALSTAFAISGALALVTVIGQVGRAITVVLGLSAGMAGIFAAGGSLMVGLRGIAVLLAAIGTSVYAASQLFDNFGDTAANAVARIVEKIGELTASLLNLPTDAIAGLLRLMGVKIDNPFGLGDGLNKLVQNAKKAREDAEAAIRIGGGRGKQGGPTAEELAAAGQAKITSSGDAGREIDTTARQAAIARIKEITAEYEKQQRLNIAKLDFEKEFVGKSEEAKQLAEAQREIFLDYVNAFDQLEKRRQTLGKEEQYLNSVIIKQQEDLYQLYLKKDGELVKSLTNLQSAKLLEEDRKRSIENITKSLEQQLKIQEALTGARLSIIGKMEDVKFEGTKIGKGELQKQMMDITEANRKAGLEASRAFAASFEEGGDGLTPERAKQLKDGLDAIASGYKNINDEQLKNLETSRQFSAGWEEAFASYKDDAFNAAMEAKTYFDAFSKGFEDVIIKMVTTGKFSFKDLANTMIAEFARVQAKKLFAGLFGGDSGGGFFSSIGKMLGFANGGNPPIGVPSIVGERGPELFVPRSAGTIVPNNQLGMNTNVTYNINAVDAASFRQMLAREPEFLYAVTEKGRSAIPSGRR